MFVTILQYRETLNKRLNRPMFILHAGTIIYEQKRGVIYIDVLGSFRLSSEINIKHINRLMFTPHIVTILQSVCCFN